MRVLERSGHAVRGAVSTGGPVLLAVLCLSAVPLFGLNPKLAISQYLHTSWTQDGGTALPEIKALAQTSGGMLWMATSQGLIRFDGARFAQWSPQRGSALPSQDVRCLRAAADGGLWVATPGGVCKVEQGRVTRFPPLEQFPCKTVLSMIEDPRGGGLLILYQCPGATALVRLRADGTVQRYEAKDGLPEQRMVSLFQDRHDNLWIGTQAGVCRWEPGQRAECLGDPAMYAVSIVETGDGQLAIADGRRKQAFLISGGNETAAGPRIPDAVFLPGAMLCDRDGNIWVGTMGEGLLRLRNNQWEKFTRNDGLSNNVVSGLAEDHEGDVWVATTRGVDRIRDTNAQIYSTRNGLSSDFVSSVYGAHDGSVWIGTTGGGLNRFVTDRVSPYVLAGMPNQVINALYEDGSNRMWAATSAGLAVETGGGRFSEVRTDKGLTLGRIFNISGDKNDHIWVADSRLGLFSVENRVARAASAQLENPAPIYRLLVSRDGAVWMGHDGGGITVLESGSTRQYNTGDGLTAGSVTALFEDREGTIWAGTQKGLNRLSGNRWIAWTAAQGLPEGGVLSITEDQTGAIWLLTMAGILRLPRNSLNDMGKRLSFNLYGVTEGLSLSTVGMTGPRLTIARDGRLWACTEDGVAVIDPARVRNNPVPPPVVIEHLVADGESIDWPDREAVFRGRDLQITYTGISLMVPERVMFRYRLFNLDKAWTEAGTRRNVDYKNLPPGNYRFQVIASNGDGIWNENGATLLLRVVPYFYQTRWFQAGCLALAGLIVWSAHQMKMRQVVSRLQLIAAERVRFSRELHDSLLQGFSGVVYLLEAAARQFETAPAKSRQNLEKALDQADESLREARQMISSMRIPALENNTLSEALRAMSSEMVSEIPVDFQFDVKGRERQGRYDAQANIFLIAREAVTNSLNHAAASRIRMELEYTPKELHLTVQDDGKGFDPEAALTKEGHWGFRGMRERARLIDASFEVESREGSGTRIEVAAPWK